MAKAVEEPQREPRNASRWIVYRQDDHGNRDIVRVVNSKDAARSLAEEFEAKGHKQLYWYAREEAGPSSA